jgi:hypothetical protein
MMELSANINFVAVLAAAIANMAIGWFWYSTSGFGNQWMDLTGMRPKNKQEEEAMKKAGGPAMAGAFVTSLVTAYVLAHFVSFLDLGTAMDGAQLGFWVWLGFAGATGLSDHLFSNKPMQLFYINTGYRLATFLVMGAILAVMM